MKALPLLLMALTLLTQSGCATTNRAKTLVFMAGVGAVAAGVGYATAPHGEKPEMHALY